MTGSIPVPGTSSRERTCPHVHDADGDVRGPGARPLRIGVNDALDLLAAGASREEILADHPYLEPDDCIVLLQLSAAQSDHPVLRSARCASWSMRNYRPHWPVSSSARGTMRLAASIKAANVPTITSSFLDQSS